MPTYSEQLCKETDRNYGYSLRLCAVLKRNERYIW